MKTTNQTGRKSLYRYSPRGFLSRLIYFLLLAIILPAFWFASCEKVDTIGDSEETTKVDTSYCALCLDSQAPIRSADIFIYQASGTQELESHIRKEYQDSSILQSDTTWLTLLPGKKTAVVIANSLKSFNLDALGRYDSIEQLQYNIGYESSFFPILSAVEEFDASRNKLEMDLEILRCKITVEHVEHSLPNYQRLEDPYIQIESYPVTAEILRENGHRATETSSDTTGLRGIVWEYFPCDVGMRPQYPGTSVFCFPCDDLNAATKPSVMIGCTIDGVPYKFRKELPVLKRGCSKNVSLVIGDNPKDYQISFR